MKVRKRITMVSAKVRVIDSGSEPQTVSHIHVQFPRSRRRKLTEQAQEEVKKRFTENGTLTFVDVVEATEFLQTYEMPLERFVTLADPVTKDNMEESKGE